MQSKYSSTESQLCTLQRGHLLPDPLRVNVLQNILVENEKSKEAVETYVQNLIKMASDNCHAGIYYKVTFSTDRAISLYSFGFWGPHKVDQANYEVSIIVSRLSSLSIAKQELQVLSRCRIVAEGSKGKVFLVNLDRPVMVPAGTWIQIEFELNGPPTFRSEKMIHKCEEPGVTFSFVDSSLQLPVIQYKLE